MTVSQPAINRHRGRWRGFEPALFALVLFILWSAAVRIGLSNGSRHDAFASHVFGTWPATFGALDGSGDLEFAIYVSFGENALLGSSAPGTETDSSDAGNINGSRFVSGDAGGEVHSLSVYVRGPIDAAPRNQFQGAIYTDSRGAPDRLLATSAVGELRSGDWNVVAIEGVLRPHTAYWLMYNTNGATASDNNLAYARSGTAPLDRIIRTPSTPRLRQIAGVVVGLANPLPATFIVLCLAVWQCWVRQPRRALIMLLAFVVALILEAALKHSIFYPFESYPSGHAIRVVFLAACVSQLFRRRSVALAAWCIATVVCVAVIYTEGHYSEEVVGGLLVGWGIASAALTSTIWGAAPSPRISPE